MPRNEKTRAYSPRRFAPSSPASWLAAALSLLGVGVEGSFLDLLVAPERAREGEHLVYEGRLAVVDVRDDGQVPDRLLGVRHGVRKRASVDGLRGPHNGCIGSSR